MEDNPQSKSFYRDMIITGNLRLVYFRVYKYFSQADYDKDDLISIGSIGLIKAVDTFDYHKNIVFSNYAIQCIDNEILMALRKKKNYKKHVCGDFTLYDDDKNTLLDTFSYEENTLDDILFQE